MRLISRLAVVAVVAAALTGCTLVSQVEGLFGSGSAPQANLAAAAEGFYTVSANEIANAINQGTLSVSAVQTVQKDENVVYAGLVKVRAAAETCVPNQPCQSPALAAALASYNAAFGTLYTDAQTGGVTLNVSTVPNPKVTP